MTAPANNPINSAQPGEFATAVTTSDSVSFSVLPRALYIGTGGDATLLLPAGNTVVFKNLSSGTILPVRASRVNATGTTAADIVALY